MRDVSDLPYWGRAEIAVRLGVTPARADRITRRAGFPAAWRITGGRVWSREDVEAWIRENWPTPSA